MASAIHSAGEAGARRRAIGGPNPMLLPLPKSRAEIVQIQRERKRLAVERARQAPWYRGKLDHIDLDRLDDPEEWQRIPIIDKEVLRAMSHAEFMEQLCVAPREQIAEFCRGKLAAYKRPRSVEFLAELPRNPSGKVLKRQLREPYWRGCRRRVAGS